MTDREFRATARTMTIAFLAACQRGGRDSDDAAALAGAALAETLGQLLGPVGAVERLRDLADVFERQLLAH